MKKLIKYKAEFIVTFSKRDGRILRERWIVKKYLLGFIPWGRVNQTFGSWEELNDWAKKTGYWVSYTFYGEDEEV